MCGGSNRIANLKDRQVKLDMLQLRNWQLFPKISWNDAIWAQTTPMNFYVIMSGISLILIFMKLLTFALSTLALLWEEDDEGVRRQFLLWSCSEGSTMISRFPWPFFFRQGFLLALTSIPAMCWPWPLSEEVPDAPVNLCSFCIRHDDFMQQQQRTNSRLKLIVNMPVNIRQSP